MRFKVKSTKWHKTEAEVLARFVSEDGWQDEIEDLDKLFQGALSKALKYDHFEAKLDKIYSYPTAAKIPAKTLILVGVGKKTDLNLDKFRQASAQVSKQVKSQKRASVAIDLTIDVFAKYDVSELTHAVVEGASLGSYSFDKYKSEHKNKPQAFEEVLLLGSPSKIQHMSNAATQAELYAEATMFARDLVNESPSKTTPTYLALVAKNLARKGEVKLEVIDEQKARKIGMEAYLAVARGSREAPKFIKLTYKGGSNKKVVIAGKAITFDTGGLSLKDAKNMELMKIDMAGGAAVLGIFSALARLKPRASVIGLIAACENMPGGAAMKPGDVVTALNGKSIEILNTDAEGRMTLADALSYAVREKPDYIIDLATLTGACQVALGEDIAGLFVNNNLLRQKLLEAARSEGEKLWELPLEENYKESNKGDIADLRNVAKMRYGGAITAALFLEEFVDKTPWAHLDIAGPSYYEKDTSVVPKGGSGFGVRTLLNFLEKI